MMSRIRYKFISRVYAFFSHCFHFSCVYFITVGVSDSSPTIKSMKKLIATMALAVLAIASPAFAADEATGKEVVYVAGMTGVT